MNLINLKCIVSAMLMMCMMPVLAQKTMYVPDEWKNNTSLYKESDPNNQATWSKSRSIESDNVIILWDKDYGNTAPNKLSSSNDYYVDLQDLLTKAEAYYQLECDQLGFVNATTSNLSKYKVMILMNHTTTWTCYGGGYDFKVPALWLNPATCKPVGLAVAHEVGHSFHYMCYSVDSNYGATAGVETGFHSNWTGSNGQAIWETTANWQALQSCPDEFFIEMYGVFQQSHNYAFSHEWHRYQAYPFLYYLCEKYGDIKTVANVWNQHETSVVDFNQALMHNKSLSAEGLYRLYYEYASKCVTWDFSALKGNSNLASTLTSNIGNFKYDCIQTAENTYQVAYSSCPQSTGFNVVPLQVPSSGTKVSIDFTAMVPGSTLSDGDKKQYLNGESQFVSTTATSYNSTGTNNGKRGFRLGFVALLKNGTRVYSSEDNVYCKGTDESTATISYTVPSNVQKLWMVVVPAPTSYIRHNWDENISNDDQWPYRFKVNGTDIASTANVTYGSASAVTSKSFTYNIERYAGLGYTASTLDITSDLSAALSFLGCESIADATVYAINATDGTEVSDAMATYDGWFTSNGEPTKWANNSTYCLKFFPSYDANQLVICNFPDLDTTIGETFSATWELAYEGKKVYFTVNSTIVEKPDNPLANYTIVKTYDLTCEDEPRTDYTPTTIALPTEEIATALGLESITDAKYMGSVSANGLTDIYTANQGYWLDAEGWVHNYNGGAFYAELTGSNSTLNIGQMPGLLTDGSVYSTTLYLSNPSTKKLVQLNISFKISETVSISRLAILIDRTLNGDATITDIENMKEKLLYK